MSRFASPLRGPRIAIALLLAGCSGGDRDGAPTLANGTQQAVVPAPPAAAPPSTAGAGFANPLLASGPDPYVVRADGVYYYTHTLGDRIGLWATTAMSRLGRATYATVFVPPATGPNSRDLWAPELHRLDGRWYLYYSAGDGSRTASDPFASQRIFVLESAQADPLQPGWVDRGRLASADPDAWAIDGTVLEHAGRRYFVWSGRASANDTDQHLYVARMTNPWTLAAGRVRISSPDFPWERAGRVGVNEGPQVMHSPWGDVFLVYSANGCWSDDYALGMLRLRSGGDPLVAADWIKRERPAFATRAAAGAYGPGHNGFFRSPDGTQDWIVYHANAAPGEGCRDSRSTRMQPVAWRADGTPEFGTPAAIGESMAAPTGEVPEP